MLTSMKSTITYDKKSIDNKTLIQLYKNMLKPRMIEEKMLILLRQGKISKWFSGIGQEAISVGVTMALKRKNIFCQCIEILVFLLQEKFL